MGIGGYVGGEGGRGEGHGARQAGMEERQEGAQGVLWEKARFIRSCMISLAFMPYTDGRI
jgi:hypothetical protein